ncbi:MAG: hypothetical protein RLZZ604_410, partial [Pseudomonadota bacterium]
MNMRLPGETFSRITTASAPTIGAAANSSVLESDRIQVVNGGFFAQQM